MAMLPDILSDDKSRRGVELRSSVLAASFALCGSRTSRDDKGNSSTNLKIESRKFYLTSLKQQRVKMILAAHSSDKIIPLAEDVAVAVMLAYYEVISPTFETSYFQHILGAKALLEMIGPSNCREGYYHQLFRTVRMYMVHISITTQSLTTFSSEEWTEIPFSRSGKTSCDHVIDILLRLPRLKLSHSRKNNVNHSSTIDFIDKVKCIWTTSGFFKSNSKADTDMPCTEKTTRTTKKHEIEIGDLKFIPGSSIIPSNSETAITISFYSLAWILILDQIQTHENPEVMELREKLLLGHCDAVLRACNYIEELEDGCAFIRTVFPLRSVALLSPNLMQREYAKYRLDFWRVSKGLGGICAVAMS